MQSENQRAFQERIAKIEARENAAESVSSKFKRHRKDGKTNQRRRGNMLMMAALLLCVAALPVLNQKFPEQFAMPSLAALFQQDSEEPADT